MIFLYRDLDMDHTMRWYYFKIWMKKAVQCWKYGETSSPVKILSKPRRRWTSEASSPNSWEVWGGRVAGVFPDIMWDRYSVGARAGLGKKTSKISLFYYLLAMILWAVKYLPSWQSIIICSFSYYFSILSALLFFSKPNWNCLQLQHLAACFAALRFGKNCPENTPRRAL